MRRLLKVLSWLFMIVGLIVVTTLISFLPTETSEPMIQPDESDMPQQTVGMSEYWDSVQSYLTGLLRGDLGKSENDEPITEVMLTYAPRSLMVLFGAFALAVPIGIALGVFFAMRKGKSWDKLKSLFTYASLSFPDFFVVFFMQWLAIKVWKTGWEVIPAAGYRDPQNMILPILTLSMLPMLYLVRLTWHSVDEVIEREPYIVTARSKGIERLLIYIRHALGNVWVRLLDHIPQLFVLMVSNLLIIEFLFYYPGSVFKLFSRLSDQTGPQPESQDGFLWDPPLMASTAIMFALCFFAIYGISRGLRLWLDPRLRESASPDGGSRQYGDKKKTSKRWMWGMAGVSAVLLVTVVTIGVRMAPGTPHEAEQEQAAGGDAVSTTTEAAEESPNKQGIDEDRKDEADVLNEERFEIVPLALGETYDDPYVLFTVDKMVAPPEEADLEQPANQKKYVSVQVTIESKSDILEIDYDPYRIYLLTSEGELTSPSAVTVVENNGEWDNRNTVLENGNSVTTVGTYEVPEDDTAVKLVYRAPFLSIDKQFVVELPVKKEGSH